ncbi:kinase-like domain-containing protein [Schizophyllum amplum]|uniref:non-specific serine/threonine protein kinase n=1 Tax=Schizophyllum amplum TaxID=97359 RepID=A0A550C120_9AGAR|nr:kinase-like domain-containing protein [Auriculariopsis ampla]
MLVKMGRKDLMASGGYGRVYKGHVMNEDESRVVAVKKARITRRVAVLKNPMLRHEACAMLALRGHPSIPEVCAYGRSQIFEYLALEMLGETIDTPLAFEEGLTMRNLIALVCQMLDALAHVHSHHIIHCDIKPDNFLFDLNPAVRQIKLIDFGIARVYRNPATLEHVQETTMPRHIGTRTYISLNVHDHHNPSRRDDMESLAYSIVDLLCDGLPWAYLEVQSRDVSAIKQTWDGSALCAGHPAVFGAFVDYARALAFQETPDYATWRRQFLAVAPSIGGDRPLYDESDRGPTVGSHRWENGPASPINAFRTALVSQESEREYVTPGTRAWLPYSTWGQPSSVADEDLIGDEQRTVREHLERIEEVPLDDGEGFEKMVE